MPDGKILETNDSKSPLRRQRRGNRSATRMRRAESIRAKIIRAGLKVFSAKGFKAATMDDIALELEATKGLLYYYFPTKENLLSAVLEQSAKIDEIEAAIGSLRTQPFPSAVRTGIYGAMDLMRANQAFIRFLHVQTLLSTHEAELVYATVYERLYRALAAEVDYFKGTGEVRPDVNSLYWARMLVDLAAICFLHAQAAPETHAIDNRYLDSMVGNLIAASAVEWPASGASAPAPARELAKAAEAAEPRN